jgi:hypothetical protein
MPLLSLCPNVIALEATVRRAQNRVPTINRTRYPTQRYSKPEQLRPELELHPDFGREVGVRGRSPVGRRVCRYYPRRPYGPCWGGAPSAVQSVPGRLDLLLTPLPALGPAMLPDFRDVRTPNLCHVTACVSNERPPENLPFPMFGVWRRMCGMRRTRIGRSHGSYSIARSARCR